MSFEVGSALALLVLSFLADAVAKWRAGSKSGAATETNEAVLATLTANVRQLSDLHALMQRQLDNHEARIERLEEAPRIRLVLSGEVVNEGDGSGNKGDN